MASPMRLNSLFFLLIGFSVTLLFQSCSHEFGKMSYEDAPKVINVSSYDPKEVQRRGSSFSPLNQEALKKNGALGMIARCGKGGAFDDKCADFLTGADRQGMLLGTYYFMLPSSNPTALAEKYVARLREIKRTRHLKAEKVLLVVDVHTKCKAGQIVACLKRIHELTGVRAVVYLENSSTIRRTLNEATASQKHYLKKHPYWLALYSDEHEGLETPRRLADASGVWKTWALWQYGGVWWEHGKSQPYHYRGGSWNSPAYFGDLSQPTERSAFNGSPKELYQFWDQHSWAW